MINFDPVKKLQCHLLISTQDKATFDCNSHSGTSLCKLQSEIKWILKQLFVDVA